MVASVSSGSRRDTKTFASRIVALMGSFRSPTPLLRVVTAVRLVSRFESAGFAAGFTACFGRLFLARSSNNKPGGLTHHLPALAAVKPPELIDQPC